MAAKLGDFFVNIDTKADTKGIKQVESGLDGLIGQAKKLGAAYLTFQTAKALINADMEIVRDAAELGRLAQDFGSATEDVERFGRAFEIMGAGVGEAQKTLGTMRDIVQDIKMGNSEKASAFGLIPGLQLQALSPTDALHNFDLVRQGFNKMDAGMQRWFVKTIGLGEKSLRVLRLNDEAYGELINQQATEAPLQTPEQTQKAERFTQMSARAGFAFDSAARSAAIATEKALTAVADGIREKGIDGAKFANATFYGFKKNSATGENKLYSEKDTLYSRVFGWNPITKKISDGIEKGLEINNKIGHEIVDFSKNLYNENKGVFTGENSQRKNKNLEDQISMSPTNWDGKKTIIINNNIQNKTDIQVKEAKDLQKDFAKHAAKIVADTYGVEYKQASENLKRADLQ